MVSILSRSFSSSGLARMGLFVLSCIFVTGCINLPASLFGGGRGPVKPEVIIPSEHFWTSDEILIIDLTGIVAIQGAQGLFGVGGPGMLVRLKDRLEAAEANPHLRAVILRIDSPGGGVTASDLIHHEIVAFRERTEIPIIAMMMDVAASGGLYIAMAADEIYALPTTITGSIGVISTLPGFAGAAEKLGIEMRVIKSGKNKDVGSPWREMSEEDRAFFQQLIDSMYERFFGIVLEARAPHGLTREKLAEFADGRVLTGLEAAELKLIDGVLYPEQVIARARELAGSEDAAIISYEYPYTYRGNIYATSGVKSPAVQLGADGLALGGLGRAMDRLFPSDARLLYMWLP